jgi:hypothetical protein
MSKQELKDLGKSKNGFQDPRKGKHERFKFTRGGQEDILGLGTKEDFVNEILYGKDTGKDHLQISLRLRDIEHRHRPGLPSNRHHGDLKNNEEEVTPEGAAHSGAGRGVVLLPGDGNVMHAPERRLQAVQNPSLNGLKHLPHGRGRLPFIRSMSDYFNHRRRAPPEKKEAPEKFKARYGKWVKALEDKPALSQRLHQLGATSLEAFGYEPPTRFMDPPDETYIEQCRVILEENLCEN